ncbi:hypothetical protein BKA81DRAFT_367341 [Phyllosticta paracitricarpa]
MVEDLSLHANQQSPKIKEGRVVTFTVQLRRAFPTHPLQPPPPDKVPQISRIAMCLPSNQSRHRLPHHLGHPLVSHHPPPIFHLCPVPSLPAIFAPFFLVARRAAPTRSDPISSPPRCLSSEPHAHCTHVGDGCRRTRCFVPPHHTTPAQPTDRLAARFCCRLPRSWRASQSVSYC